jgi:hypothetical protein
MNTIDTNKRLLDLALQFNSASADRAAIAGLVAEKLKTKDEVRKQAREQAKALLESLHDHSAAVVAANAVVSLPEGDQQRKRFKDFLKVALEQSYPDYDFPILKEAGKRDSFGVPVFCGDHHAREARKLVLAYEKVVGLGLKKVTAETVAACLRPVVVAVAKKEVPISGAALSAQEEITRSFLLSAGKTVAEVDDILRGRQPDSKVVVKTAKAAKTARAKAATTKATKTETEEVTTKTATA